MKLIRFPTHPFYRLLKQMLKQRGIMPSVPNIPLRWVLTVPFMVQVVGIVGVVGYLSYRSGQAAVDQLVAQLMTETGDRITQNLRYHFDNAETLTHETQSAIRLGLLDWQNQSQLESYFVEHILLNQDISGVMMTTENKDFLAVGRPFPDRLAIRTRNPATGSLENYAATLAGDRLSLQDVLANYDPHNTPPYNPWYKAAQSAQTGLWQPLVSVVRGQDKPLLMVAYFLPFVDAQGTPQGVLSSSLYLDQVGDFLRPLSIGKTGQAFIIDQQGLLIATSTGEQPFRQDLPRSDQDLLALERWQLPAQDSQNPVTQAAAVWGLAQLQQDAGNSQSRNSQSRNSESARIQLNNQAYFGHLLSFQLDDQIQWTIVVVVPEADFMADIHQNVQRTIILCGLALVGSMGIGLWTARRLTRSLLRLTQSSQTVAAGTLTSSLPPTRIVEVASLTDSFRLMMMALQAAEQLQHTAAQELERQVAEKTAALTQAQRMARVGSWETDIVTGKSTWSSEQYRILGFDPAEPLPPYPDILKLVPMADQAALREAMEGAIAQGTPYTVEHGILRGDGAIAYVVSRGEAVCNDQGQVVKLVGTVTDISDRKQAELALQEASARQQAIISVMPDLIYVVSDEGVILDQVTVKAEMDLFSLGPPMTNKTICDVGTSEIVERKFAALQSALATGKIELYEQLTERDQHRQYEEVRCVPMPGNRVLVMIRDITERKQTEIALQTKTEELDRFFSVTLELLCIANTDGYFLRLNRQWEKTLGYQIADLEGSQFIDFVHPDDREKTLNEAKKLQNQNVTLNFINRYRCKDGSYRWIEWSSSLDGDLIYSAARDITDRRQTEAALGQSEKRYRLITELTSDYIYKLQINPDGTMAGAMVTERFTEMTGFSLDEVKDINNWNRFIYPDDLENTLRFFQSVMQSRQPQSTELRFMTKAGKMLWVNLSARPECDESQETIIAIEGAVKNITDRKQLEQEIIKNRDFRELLFNELSDALFLVDPKSHRTIDCNQRAIELFEVASKAELIDIEGHTLQKWQLTCDELNTCRQNIQEKGFWNLELEYVTRRGREFWGDISVKLIVFGEQEFNLVRVVDISDRKYIEAALQQAKQDLEDRIDDLNRRNWEMERLSNMSDFLQTCLTVEAVYKAIAHYLEPLFPGCAGAIFSLDPFSQQLRPVVRWGNPLHSERCFHFNDCWALRRRQMQRMEPHGAIPICHHLLHQASLTTLCTPMITQAETLGLFYLSAETPEALPETKQQIARTVAEQLALAIANLNLREILKQQSIHDPLTGLFNRRYLEESLAQEISRAQRFHHPIGVIMIDIDHFKHFNDTYGHDAGDYVLQAVATFLRENVRRSDIACRYGGEELMLILPTSPLTETLSRAEEICLAISQLSLIYQNQCLGSLTASFGVATFPRHGITGIAVMQAADAALYRAKALGRNQVVSAP